MDYRSFRRHLGKASLTVNAFAKMIGVQPSAVSNYAKKDEVPQTYAVLCVCLGELGDMGVDVEKLLKKYSVISNDEIITARQLDMFSESGQEAAHKYTRNKKEK